MPEPFDANKTPVMPMLHVDSIEKALDYYANVLGFEKTVAMPGQDGKTLVHAEFKVGPTTVMLGRRDTTEENWKQHFADPLGRGVVLYAYVPNVDEFHRKAKENGAQVLEAPKDQYWGDRTATIVDPHGYRWTIAQHIFDYDPSKAPVPERPIIEATA